MTLTIPNSIADGENASGNALGANFAAIKAWADAVDALLAGGTEATGVVKLYASGTAPTGWLLCQGQAVSRSTYPDLFALIGTTYGAGDGITTFNVPNLKGRVPLGLDGSVTAFNALAKTGGSRDAVVVDHTHADTFSIGNESAHTHSTNPAKTSLSNFAWGGKNWHALIQSTGGLPSTGLTSQVEFKTATTAKAAYAGLDGTPDLEVDIPATTSTAGSAHNHPINGSVTKTGVAATDKNLQPFLVMNFIIKT